MTSAPAHETTAAQLRQIRDHSRFSRRVRKDETVLYFGRSDFADNTKYAYLNAVARADGPRPMWCTTSDSLYGQLSDAGLPVFHLMADADATIDLLLHASAGVFCVNPFESLGGSDVLTSLLDGAVKVQLWHGVSVKHLLLRLARHLPVRDPSLRVPWEFAVRADYVLSTAEIFDEYWSSVFGSPYLVRAGMPRNEVLLRDPSPTELIGATTQAVQLPTADRRRPAVLLVPTWQRPNGRQTLADETFLELCSVLGAEDDIDIYLKLHPVYGVEKDRQVGRLHLIPSGVDIYPHMRHFDVLVTDYSSIMFDYLHVDKPILRLDMSNMFRQTFEPDFSLVPDVEFADLFTLPTFPDVLRRVLADDRRGDQRRLMRDLVFGSDPSKAAGRVVDLVNDLARQRARPAFEVV